MHFFAKFSKESTMTIFCTGATGLIGYNFVLAAAGAGHRVVAVCGKNSLPNIAGAESLRLDLTDSAALQRAVLDVFPDAIVNCAAIASPADVDKNPELAEKLNARMPEVLAQLANHIGARLIHLSTDMVFDGSAAPYANTDVPMPATLYGTTKLMAEKFVLKAAAPVSVVLRLSHVSGNSLTTRRSLHEKLLRAWASGQKARCRTDEIKCPLSASVLADLLLEICLRPKLSGVYHYAGASALSRYEMAARIAAHFGLDAEKFVEPISGGSPVDLTLDCGALLSRVKTPSTPFAELLEEMQVPADLRGWLAAEGGKLPMRRFKL